MPRRSRFVLHERRRALLARQSLFFALLRRKVLVDLRRARLGLGKFGLFEAGRQVLVGELAGS